MAGMIDRIQEGGSADAFSVGLLPWKKRMCSDAFYVFVISDQAA